MKVVVLKNVVDGHGHYGRKGDVIDLPDELAKQWIKAQHVKEHKPGSKAPASPAPSAS